MILLFKFVPIELPGISIKLRRISLASSSVIVSRVWFEKAAEKRRTRRFRKTKNRIHTEYKMRMNKEEDHHGRQAARHLAFRCPRSSGTWLERDVSIKLEDVQKQSIAIRYWTRNENEWIEDSVAKAAKLPVISRKSLQDYVFASVLGISSS